MTAVPTTMKAWLYTYTTPTLEKNLTLTPSARTPFTPLQSTKVLVQVLSASINPADYKVPEMGPVAKALITTPASPGMDFAGRVAATGPEVTDFEPGQLVYGTLGMPGEFGSLGEYVVVGTGNIVPLPKGVEPDQGATVGVAAQTAYQSLVGYVSSGDKVFVNGGSGGCGIFVIQMAKVLGCHVTTTCSSRNVQLCKDLGADQVVDYSAQDVLGVLKSQGQVYDHVVDHIGLPSNLYSESDAFLRPGKAFVQVGAVSMMTFTSRLLRPGLLGGGKRKYVILMLKNNKQHLAQIGEWMAQGKVRAKIDSTYEFDDAVEAFEKLRTGRARGKIIVHVTEI